MTLFYPALPPGGWPPPLNKVGSAQNLVSITITRRTSEERRNSNSRLPNSIRQLASSTHSPCFCYSPSEGFKSIYQETNQATNRLSTELSLPSGHLHFDKQLLCTPPRREDAVIQGSDQNGHTRIWTQE